jgi:hypothetical protein
MAVVWTTALGVERYAAAGRDVNVPRLDCPGCKKPMSYWGWYQRDLRVGPVGPAVGAQATPQSMLCQPCRAAELHSHGRLDAIGAIGSALQVMANHPGTGAGTARALGLP